MGNKIWKIQYSAPQIPVIDKLALLRPYIRPMLEEVADPFLMQDMDKALERIGQAIERSERIVVFGDYDADGVTATAVLVKTLKKIGAEVSFRIPHRMKDGYSLKNYFLDELHALDVKVVITVDNGIAAAREIQHAYDLGMDIIVTDHHTPPPPDAMPRAHAILNPKVEGCLYPCKELSGSAVALKLCEALIAAYVEHSTERERFRYHLFQIASIGIIADCMLLIDENRSIVQAGIEHMRTDPVPGIRALAKVAGVALDHISSVDVAFMLAPRINAAGRIDHALQALQLFLAGDETCARIAQQLDELNKTRKETTKRFFEQALTMLQGWNETEKIIILSSPDWNSGINGLVASRLVEMYHVPVLIFAEREDDVVGSARSIEEFNMIEALTIHRQFLAHYGGHPGAAGCSIHKDVFPQFIEEMKKTAQACLGEKQLVPVLRLDTEIKKEECSLDVYDKLQILAPFGVGNPEPLFYLSSIRIQHPKAIGKEQHHFSCEIEGIRCIGFSLGKEPLLFSNQEVDLAVQLTENSWQGKRTVQLRIIAARLSQSAMV